MKLKQIALFGILYITVLGFSTKAQDVSIPKDSLEVNSNSEIKKISPKKASIYAALFPGLGQIYNGKYWKLPIVYGGYAGLIYVLGWNNKYYSDFYDAYKTISKYQTVVQMSVSDKDYLNELFKIPYWNMNTSPSHFDNFKTQLKSGKDYYRRSRDLSIIAIAALHVLSIIDASVDANLFDFEINNDLSMRVDPLSLYSSRGANLIGINVAFNF